MTKLSRFLGQIDKVATLSYMRVLSRYPGVKHAEIRVLDAYVRLLTSYREKGANQRALPDFIIVGGMKCGTSSLFKYLDQHPQLFGSSHKEVRFFSRDDFYARGESWYRAHFPRLSDMPKGSLAFESTPDYLFFPQAPSRIATVLPDARIIILLRNPTERAISHYFHNIKKGREKQSILDAMREEGAVYKRRSMYKEQVERYYDLFNRSNIKIVSSELFFNSTMNVLRDIYEFLDVDRDVQITDLLPRQVGFNRERVDDEVYQYLNSYFGPYNRQLFDMIGHEFDWPVQ